MNFKKLYERTHLKEEVRRNIMAVERFLQANRTDYSYTSFLNWLEKRDDIENFIEFKDNNNNINNIDKDPNFYYVAAAAYLDVLHADPSTYPGLGDNIKLNKSKNPEIFEKNYNWIAPTMEKYLSGADLSKKDYPAFKDWTKATTTSKTSRTKKPTSDFDLFKEGPEPTMEEIKADFLDNFSMEDAQKFDDAKLDSIFTIIKNREKYSMKQLQYYVKSKKYIDSVKNSIKSRSKNK